MVQVVASAKLQDTFRLTDKELKKAMAKATRKTFKEGSRDVAKQVAKEAKIPYAAARKRTKARYRLSGEGTFFFGLNPVAVKYLDHARRTVAVSASEAEKQGFYVEKLGGHWFRRTGKRRLPIQRIEVPIEDEVSPLVTEEFPEEMRQKLINNLFLEIDKIKGTDAGTSKDIFNA